jgi:CBS domain-containing protein
VADVLTKNAICLRAVQTVGEVRAWINSQSAGAGHQGFPVVDENGKLIGVVTRRDLLASTQPDSGPIRDAVHRPPLTVSAESTLRHATDQMVGADVGRLAVVDRDDPSKLIGIITRGDVLSAHRRRMTESTSAERSIRVSRFGFKKVVAGKDNGDVAK